MLFHVKILLHDWSRKRLTSNVNKILLWKCKGFGVWCTKDCYRPRSYTIWQKNMFVYSLISNGYWCLQTLNGRNRWGKCVTWIASELDWRYLTRLSKTRLYVWVGTSACEASSSHSTPTILHYSCLNTLSLYDLILVKVSMLLWTSTLICT